MPAITKRASQARSWSRCHNHRHARRWVDNPLQVGAPSYGSVLAKAVSVTHWIVQNRCLSYTPVVQATARRLEPQGKVLIVDDYADARASLRELVEELGLEVAEAADGQQALDFLIEQAALDVRLVLLDLDMPRMTGWELLKLIKSYVRFAGIPVVVVSKHTAYLRPSDRQLLHGCFEAPADPLKLRDLIETLLLH